MAGVATTVLMWLLTTGVILAVPFGIWWLVDRARRQTPAPAPAPLPPPRAPLVAVTPAAPRRAPAPPADPPTAPVPVPRGSRTLTVVPDPRATGRVNRRRPPTPTRSWPPSARSW